MNLDISLGGILNYLLQRTQTKVPSRESQTRRNGPELWRSPSDYSVLIADNSYGFIYVKNAGGYIPVTTSLAKGTKRYFTVSDAFPYPIVPDPSTTIIEDGNCYSNALSDALMLRGYNVDMALNGLEATEMVRGGDYDLIIMGSQIKPNADDKPTQEGSKRLLENVLRYKPNLGVILTVMPEAIEPIDTDLRQMLGGRVKVIDKPYEIPSPTNGSSNKLLDIIINQLGIRPT